MSTGSRIAVIVVLIATGGAPAQTPGADLSARVEAYLGEESEEQAAILLERVLTPPPRDSDLLAAVQKSAGPLEDVVDLTVPHRGLALQVAVHIPQGHSRAKPRLPVILDVSGGVNLRWLKLGDVITVQIPGYTPPEFSDDGRDGFLKVLRVAAHRAHGDPDRLWLTGFSWAGHACYDIALHRPGFLRGIVPLGGGPRRKWFRLLPNVRGVKIWAFCGVRDDRELVWNLKEVANRRKKLRLAYTVAFDMTKGHTLPLEGMQSVAQRLPAVEALPRAASGTIRGDAARIETPLLRFDEIDERRVHLPRAIPVSPSLSFDGKRRATIKAMRRSYVKVDWKIKRHSTSTRIELRSSGVEKCTVFLRADEFGHGEPVTVKAGSKVAYKGPIATDPRILLEEARRTGERINPAIARIEAAFR